MKLIIKSNGKITKTKTEKSKYGIESVNIDFEGSYVWSDLELWLEDDNGKYLDHLSLNVSKRNKLKAQK